MPSVNVKIGDRVEYKTHDGRGRPIKAFVLGKSQRVLLVCRTTNSQVVKIKPVDVIRMAKEVKNKKPSAA